MNGVDCCPALLDYALLQDEVHVWRIGVDWSRPGLRTFSAVLSSDEQQKAERFHFASDRVRYVVGRGALRAILAQCLNTDAERLCFGYGQFGKPYLARSASDIPLQFNVSHSGELILIALAIGRAVGTDVERVQNDLQMERVAASFFSPYERRALQSIPAHFRVQAFFDCWTRKEAYIKAIGNGLSLGLDQFDVCFVPGQEPRLVATRPDPAEARRWALRALDVGPDYRAALAVEGNGWQLKKLDWPVEAMG
jgi:4'-phosphopantetheinyl transferase